jgi:hypothetical protein
MRGGETQITEKQRGQTTKEMKENLRRIEAVEGSNIFFETLFLVA